MMNSKQAILALALAASVAVPTALKAQGTNGWFLECFDTGPPDPPPPPYPYTEDYDTSGVGNQLISFRIGVSGSVELGDTGDPGGPCWSPARTLDAAGRFAFGSGPLGSVQTTFDNSLAFTMGFPRDPVGDFSYAMIAKGDDPTVVPTARFGDPGLNGIFVGASNNYLVALWADADVSVQLRVDAIGDAARMRWRLINQQAEVQGLGLWFGAYCGMRTRNAGVVDSNGFNQAHSLLGTNTGIPKLTPDNFIGHIQLPTLKPARNEKHFFRNRPGFPKFINIEFGQSESYGIRFDLDNSTNVPDQTPVDEFLIGNYGSFTSPGLLWNNVMRNRVFLGSYEQESADIFLNETGIIEIFHQQPVQPGAFRDIVNYVKTAWSVGDYSPPYIALLDAPRLVASTPNQGLNDRAPNPFTVRVYVDNKYAELDKEVDLQNVKFTISLPPGLSLANGETAVKTKARINSNVIDFVEWQVEADDVTFGVLPYSVKIEPVPGPTKVLTGTIVMSTTPRFDLKAGANMITLPWNFADTSFENIIYRETVDGNGNVVRTPLVEGQDYRAYYYAPDTKSYVQASSAERGRGVWLVLTSNQIDLVLNTANTPPDQASGGYLYNLRHGWNLIGNPYPYAVPISQIIAVAEDDPRVSFTWQDLVTQGFVSPSLAYWERSSDPNNAAGGTYRFTEGLDAVAEPHRGYWIYVSTFRPIRLLWPAVYIEGLPNSGRSNGSNGWQQTDKRWRLQIAARTHDSLDAYNYVGLIANTKEAQQWTLPKPPQAPGQKVQISFEESVDGQPTRLAQAITDRLGRKEWKVIVSAQEATDVTLTWPNLSTVPRNVRFRLTDKATNTTRDLRSISGYTLRMNEAGTRELILSMEPGSVATRAVIGNVIVSRPSRDPHAPVTISYALSSEASTTIRILSGAGKEVFVVTRGRADNAGQNSAIWALRDSADRAVAPGAYRVEIVAETQDGERVRKIVPVNVTR
jgi:hypothetical protein